MRRILSLLLSLLVFVSGLLLAILPAATLQPLAAQGCGDAAEVVEQSFDPGDVVAPDSAVTVAWTLRNSGDCEWSRSYRLLFVDGERMDGPRTLRLRNAVEPGETVTLAVDVVAPAEAAIYRGVWQLRNADGERFGPELVVELAVDEQTAVTTDVVLPEVLVFGGMGGGDDPESLRYCVMDGALVSEAALVVDEEGLQYRHTSLYLCSFAEGEAITIKIVDPEGNEFSRSYVEDAPVSSVDDDGVEHFGTVLEVELRWINQAPTGEWLVKVAGEEVELETVIDVPPPFDYDAEFEDVEPYPTLDNWPTAPVDPFRVSLACNYLYDPGQEMMVSGSLWPPNTTLPLGIYQERMDNGYLVGQLIAETDDNGDFLLTTAAQAEGGDFHFVLMQGLVPEGFSEDGRQFNPGYGGELAFSCYTVELPAADEALSSNVTVPLRLAMATGELGAAEIAVMDFATGEPFYPTYTEGDCDTSEPAWWPDGEWLVYQSNCIEDWSEGFLKMSAADDYDLYGRIIDLAFALPEEETFVRLTETPALHETEPDVNVNGLIVYRETPVGESLDAVGDLRVLNISEATDTSLGILGRAPVWSPDGTRLAFMSDAEGTWQVYLYDLDDERVTLVSEACETHCRLPAWSPNGRQIIYHKSVSLEDFTPSGLWIASVSGLSKPRLYLAGAYGRPSWSSEGWIAFQGPQGIYRAPPGSEPTAQLYLYSDEWSIYWSPVWSR